MSLDLQAEGGLVDGVMDPPAPAEYTLSGLAHGGGWVALLAAAGVAMFVVTDWDRHRAGGAAVCGSVTCAVAATLLVPAGGLENASAYWRAPAAEPTFQRGLSVTLWGGVGVLFAGVLAVLSAAPSRRPRPESVILAGLAFAVVGALLPWGVESVPGRHWRGVPEWSGSLSVLVLCPYAALVLAEGLSRRLAVAASAIGAGLLAALLAELALVNAWRVASDMALSALLVPGRVFPVAYYLLLFGAGALLYGGGTALRGPD